MTAWVFGSDSVPVTGTGATCTPNAPSGSFKAGDLLLCFFTEGFGSHTMSAVSPWVDITPHVLVTSSQYIFARLADSSSTPMMTGTYSGSTNFRCYSMVFTGPSTTLVVDVSADRAGNNVQTIGGQVGNLTPTMDGCLGLAWGAKNKTSASNATVFSYPAADNWITQLDDVMPGSASAFVVGYQIQTTATTIGPAQATGTVADATTQPWKNVIVFIQPPTAPVGPSLGYVRRPGSPNLASPRNPLQFRGVTGVSSPGRSADGGAMVALSQSLFSGSLANLVRSLGFVPTSGPGLMEPFSLHQFLFPISNDNPSPTDLPLQGGWVSQSLAYGLMEPPGELDGITAAQSLFYGQLDGVIAGTMGGILPSQSLFSGELTGVGALAGISLSQSEVLVLQIDGSFQPLIPYTAVVDVRLGIGYQPWKVHKDGTIG